MSKMSSHEYLSPSLSASASASAEIPPDDSKTQLGRSGYLAESGKNENEKEKVVSMSPGLQMSPLPKLTPYADGGDLTIDMDGVSVTEKDILKKTGVDISELDSDTRDMIQAYYNNGKKFKELELLVRNATTKIPKLMDFYVALKEVEKGKKITKAEWEDNSVYVYLKGEFLTLRKADGKDYNFIIRDADMLGTDWKVI